MSEKSEAQIKNEEEVRRIMAERGYSPASSKKQVKKVFGIDFPFKLIISGVIGVAIIAGGWIFLHNYIFENEKDNNFPSEEVASTENDEELMGFQNCLGKVDTSEIALDDSEFWNKHISRYEQIMTCYEEYPSVANSSEKTKLQNELDKLRENSKSAEADDTQYRNKMAEIDAEYNRAIAENQARYEQNRAKLDAKTDALFEKYDREQAEKNARYEQEKAERETKQAKCDSFKSQYPDIDTYKTKNGNLDELYSNWQSAQNAYYSAVNSYNAYMSKYGTQHSEEYLERQASSLDKKKAEMDAAHNAWNFSDTSLSNEYNNKFREACL